MRAAVNFEYDGAHTRKRRLCTAAGQALRAASFETPTEFENASGAWLAQAPRRNNLILSILHRAMKLAEGARGWLISSDGGPEIAVLQTSPHQQATISDGS